MTNNNVKLLPPGGCAAKREGCACPVLDNCHGSGYRHSGSFIIASSCPIHGAGAEPLTEVGLVGVSLHLVS